MSCYINTNEHRYHVARKGKSNQLTELKAVLIVVTHDSWPMAICTDTWAIVKSIIKDVYIAKVVLTVAESNTVGTNVERKT